MNGKKEEDAHLNLLPTVSSKKEDETPVTLEGREGTFTMVERTMTLPPELLYNISSKEGGLLSSCWDLLSREGGIEYSQPIVEIDEEWRVRVTVGATYFNRAGKRVVDHETYEIDVMTIYQYARANWEQILYHKKGDKALLDPDDPFQKKERKRIDREWVDVVVRKPVVQVIKTERGIPNITYTLPDDAEIKLYEAAMNLKRHKLSKAITCAHRRLVQRAVGIKSINREGMKGDDWKKNVEIPIYSFLPDMPKSKIRKVNDLYGDDGVGADLEEEPASPTYETGKSNPKAGRFQKGEEEPPYIPPEAVKNEDANSGPESTESGRIRKSPESEPAKENQKSKSTGRLVNVFVEGHSHPHLENLKKIGFFWGVNQGYGKRWVCEGCEEDYGKSCMEKILSWKDPDDEEKRTLRETGAVSVRISPFVPKNEPEEEGDIPGERDEAPF